jgi:quinol monooxygenase YgiN
MITIIARMTAKEGEFDNMRAFALELSAAVSANEPANDLYAICEGGEPNTLILVERYADEASIEAHRNSDHLKTIGRKIRETLAFRHEVLFRLTDCA